MDDTAGHKTKNVKKITTCILFVLVLAACRKEYVADNGPLSRPANTYSGKLVRSYFTLLCTLSKSTAGFFPPQVARAYGYMGLAGYEAVVHGISGGQSLAGQLHGLSRNALPYPVAGLEYNWGIASNAALADMARKMFETNISAANVVAIDNLEKSGLADLSVSTPPAIVERSVQFGKAIAEALYQYAATDGGNKSYLDPFQLPYTIAIDPGYWVPTNAVVTPIAPRWGNCRPFIVANVTNTQGAVPLPFSTSTTSSFYKEAMEVYNQVRNNTPQQITIAKYWSDDPFNTCTPTGHTFNIMTQLLDESGATLEKTAVAYAKLGIAENDAFIACWKQKYKHMLLRPVSYIRSYIDPTFTTVLGTPAFPAFTSGHSAQIAAGSRVFIDMFNYGSNNFPFTDKSQVQYGFAARSFSNFNQMAEECATSRLYGGIHYPMDNEAGLDQGRIAGDNVVRMLQWPKNIR